MNCWHPFFLYNRMFSILCSFIHSFNQYVISAVQYYQGTGTNKRMAKMAAAEGALRGIGQWTEEDDKVKAVQAQGEAEAAAKSAEKVRLVSRLCFFLYFVCDFTFLFL